MIDIINGRRVVVEVTDNEIAKVLRAKTGAERLEIVDGLYQSAWQLIEANVSASHPDWDRKQIITAVAARIRGSN